MENMKSINLPPMQWLTTLIVCTFCLCVASSSIEPANTGENQMEEFQIRNSTFLFQKNISNPIASAREYLGKFGWVEATDWTAISPRKNETIDEGKIMLGIEGGTPYEPLENTTGLNREGKMNEITDAQFVNALRSFQEANTLEVTGNLNEATLLMMTQLRCGVPDQTSKANSTNGVVDNSTNADEDVSLEQNAGSSNFYGNETSSSASDYTTTETTESISVHSVRRRSLTDETENVGYDLSVQRSHLSPAFINETRFTADSNEDVTELVQEGELPKQSRVESMKEVLEALRKETLLGKGRQQFKTNDASSYNPNLSNLMDRMLSAAQNNQIQTRRKKRSAVYKRFNRNNGWGLAFAKKVITWRMVQEWPSTLNPLMSASEIWFTVKLAFRMWSEVIPRSFKEDNDSPVGQVDVLIGFGTGSHNRCPVKFENTPFTNVYAHAWPLPKAEIHFNDIQPFVPLSWLAVNGGSFPFGSLSTNSPISLLKVAIHEIGHALGLPHSSDRNSIMNPVYKPHPSPNLIELSIPDRESIKDIYGACDLSFDVVFDWVRPDRSPTSRHWKYNTYFFRKTWYWLYENRAQRPRYGDPKLTAKYWRGLMQYPVDPHNKIDGAVHIRSWRSHNGPTFFFKGDSYTEYDSVKDQTKRFNRHGRAYPRRIEDDFEGIPYPINTVFYNFKEELLYFFKGTKVYRYNWLEGRLRDSAHISRAFPGWGGAASLPSNIDAAYYSYAYQAIYFFKGSYYWKLADDRDRSRNKGIHIPYLAVSPRQKISSKWKYLCDVNESELVMNLPST